MRLWRWARESNYAIKRIHKYLSMRENEYDAYILQDWNLALYMSYIYIYTKIPISTYYIIYLIRVDASSSRWINHQDEKGKYIETAFHQIKYYVGIGGAGYRAFLFQRIPNKFLPTVISRPKTHPRPIIRKAFMENWYADYRISFQVCVLCLLHAAKVFFLFHTAWAVVHTFISSFSL